MPQVSVIIPAHNYGKYLKRALRSVLSQQFTDYEIIVVNDGSTDDTAEALVEFNNHPKIKIITHTENQGLVRSCHEAIQVSTGEYIIRLDADDYFDENALSVLSNILDINPEIGLVYPDYFLISEEGNVSDYVRLPKVGKEAILLDLPANGAGTMFRRSCYDAVGGYDLSLRWQDDYDLWLKFIKYFQIYNVNLPLFYYRRHGTNMSSNMKEKLRARRYVKQSFVERELKEARPSILGIIPARVHDFYDYLAIRELGGKPLIAYTIEEALKTPLLDRVIFTTEDITIAETARSLGIEVIMRTSKMTEGHLQQTILHVLDKLSKVDFHPEIIAILYVNSPFRKEEHITEAINTLLIYATDSVISVCEDLKFHYHHDMHGLTPLFEKRLLRVEKEALYEENGAIHVFRRNVINEQNLMGKRIGHILMTEGESIHIKSEDDFWLAEQIVKRNGCEGG